MEKTRLQELIDDESKCIDIKDAFLKEYHLIRRYADRTLEQNLADLMECVEIPVLCATIIQQLKYKTN